MTEAEKEQSSLDYQLKLLYKLGQTEEFQVWRDQVCKPVLAQIESQLKNSDAMPEAILRGTLKHYFSEKGRFYDIFERAEGELRSQAEQAEFAAGLTPPA